MTTWGVQLTTLESRASEHERFATALISQLADPLKHLATRSEDLRKHHADYAAKLERERDGQYADLKKTKGKYDTVCQEVENRRKKIESSYDHGKTKAKSAYEQQQSDMRNMKVGYNSCTRVGLLLTVAEYVPHHNQRHQQTKGEILPRIRSGSA